MPKKKKIESPLKDYRIVQFPDGEVRPFVVAAKDIEKIILGYSKKTAANDRCKKTGPRYFMVGSRPYYLVQILIDYFTQNPVETTPDV